jgi:hypothetical protein
MFEEGSSKEIQILEIQPMDYVLSPNIWPRMSRVRVAYGEEEFINILNSDLCDDPPALMHYLNRTIKTFYGGYN